jgi:hypothetical protein
LLRRKGNDGQENIKEDIAKRNFLEGLNIIKEHPIFSCLERCACIKTDTSITGNALASKIEQSSAITALGGVFGMGEDYSALPPPFLIRPLSGE